MHGVILLGIPLVEEGELGIDLRLEPPLSEAVVEAFDALSIKRGKRTFVSGIWKLPRFDLSVQLMEVETSFIFRGVDFSIECSNIMSLVRVVITIHREHLRNTTLREVMGVVDDNGTSSEVLIKDPHLVVVSML